MPSGHRRIKDYKESTFILYLIGCFTLHYVQTLVTKKSINSSCSPTLELSPVVWVRSQTNNNCTYIHVILRAETKHYSLFHAIIK